MIQFIAVGAIVVAIIGGIWSYNSSLRAEGEALALAELKEQQVAAAKENERIAELGRQEAVKLLEDARKRSRAQAAQLAATQQLMREQSDARAKVDVAYSIWREVELHPYPEQRLRNALAPTAEPSGSRVPARIEIPARQNNAAVAATPIDERRLDHIRRSLGLADSIDLASR